MISHPNRLPGEKLDPVASGVFLLVHLIPVLAIFTGIGWHDWQILLELTTRLEARGPVAALLSPLKPDMPSFWTMLRRCGTLKFSVMRKPSNDIRPPVPKRPAAGSRL